MKSVVSESDFLKSNNIGGVVRYFPEKLGAPGFAHVWPPNIRGPKVD